MDARKLVFPEMKCGTIYYRNLMAVYRRSIIGEDCTTDEDGFGQGLECFLHCYLNYIVFCNCEYRSRVTSVTVAELVLPKELENYVLRGI